MKKIFLILVVVFMIVSFSACADTTVKGSVVEISENGDAMLDIMPQKLMEIADIGDTVVVSFGNFSEEMLFVDEIVNEDGKLQLFLNRNNWDINIAIYNGDFCQTYGIKTRDKLSIIKKLSSNWLVLNIGADEMFSLFRKKKIDTVKIVDEIENTVFGWAKQHGFKKYGRTFNRIVDKDIVQVINFQNGCPEKRVYGVLFVNLGIRVPECESFPYEQKKYYKEYECNIRCTLDEYIDKKENPYNLKDNPQKIADDIIQKLENVILPIFNTLSSRENIIKHLKNYAEFNSMRNHLVDRDIDAIKEILKKK